MIFSRVLRYTEKKITCYLDHAREDQFYVSAFFNSEGSGQGEYKVQVQVQGEYSTCS